MNLPIEDLKKSLKIKLTNGFNAIFEALVEIIPDNSSKFNTLISLKSQHKKYKKDWLLKIISQEDATLQLNQLNARMLGFIDDLEDGDLQEPTGEPASDDRFGKVCFRIPPTMQVNERSECTVWISFDEETLLKEIQLEIDDQMQNVRVSDTMGVEMFCDSDGEAFSIKTYDESVQPVERDLTTQWAFRVTPLKVGKHPLILRIVAVVEQRGKELKKSLVLEEEINIVATATDEVAAAKQITGKAMMNGFAILPLIFPKGNADGVGSGDVVPEASIGSASSVGSSFSIMKALGIIALLVGGFFIFQQMTKGDSQKLNATSCLENTTWEAIQSSGDTSTVLNYLRNCPDGPHAVEATNLLGTWRNIANQNAAPVIELDTTVLNPIDTTMIPEVLVTREVEPRPVSEQEEVATPQPPTIPPSENTNPLTTTTPTEIPTEIKIDEPVDFRVASFKPVHPNCIEKDREDWQTCTEGKIRDLVKKSLKRSGKSLKGTVRVSFLIEKDGSVNTDIPNDNDNDELTTEVIKALQKLPKFKSGQNSKGNPIKIKYTIPVRMKN